VIVLDANILLYAYDSTAPHHTKAKQWIERVFSSDAAVGLPWQSVWAFLRIVSSPALPGKRFSIEEAAQIVECWLEQPNVLLLSPGDRHWSLFRQVMVDGQARGPLVTDAQLAALTIEFGGMLYTTDRDFARFPGLRWTNPLA
jgi:toxin-antitoxin system PIN domain toxin